MTDTKSFESNQCFAFDIWKSTIQLCLNNWKKFTAIPATFFCIGVIYAVYAPPFYRATAIIMPPQQNNPTSMLLSSLGGASLGGAGASGLGSALGLKNPNEIYVSIFLSQNIQGAIISRYALQKYYSANNASEARIRLNKATLITAGKDGLINIDVTDKDPAFAATLANAYVEELRRLTQSLSFSSASQRRNYFESQLNVIKDSLSKAEFALMNFQERTGIINTEAQGMAGINAASQLRGEIASKEIELEILLSSRSSNNPQVIQMRTAIGSLKRQLRSLTHGKGDDIWMSREKAPEFNQEYIRLMRSIKYFEALFEMTARQFEVARMEESNDGLLIQVIDAAQAPELRDGPKRARLVISTTAIGTLFSFLMLLLRSWRLNRKYSTNFKPMNIN